MHSHTPSQKSSLLRGGLVAGSVVGAASLGWAEAAGLTECCDVLEFRADGMRSQLAAVQRAMEICTVPALLTVRAPEEGGQEALSLPQRLEIFLRLMPAAALVDVEMAGLEFCQEVLQEARRLSIPVVASYHDFTGTPALADLEARATAALEAGASAVKFATTLRSSQDLAVLMTLQERLPGICATMGMGPLGRVSRLVLASLGSVLNYGYLDQPTIPGQWEAKRLKQLLRELQP